VTLLQQPPPALPRSRDPPHLWIVGGLSGAIQIGLLVRLSYQRRPVSRDGIGKLCGQFLRWLAAFS
jgi:hypothetical protein